MGDILESSQNKVIGGAERICETLSWFPTKVTMLLTSSNDLIIAGINDVVHALQNPSPGSPLAPLNTSQVTALETLTAILTGVAAKPKTAPSLRVETAPPLRVATEPPIQTAAKPDEDNSTQPAAPLRVAVTPAPSPARAGPAGRNA